MIPLTIGLLNQDIEMEQQPDRTYRMDQDREYIRGHTESLDAVKQAAFKILNTERYQHVIYSWDYGIETMDLYGEPMSYVCPELERRITEALACDPRIMEVTDFEFEMVEKGVLHVTFMIHTTFGTAKMEKEVEI